MSKREPQPETRPQPAGPTTLRPPAPIANASVRRAAAVVVLAGLLAFANSLGGAFVFDDVGQIVASEKVRSLWPIRTWLSGNARPVVTFTLAVNYALGGLDPFGYHLVNLAIHLAAGLVLFGIVRRTLLRISDFGFRIGPLPAGALSTSGRFDDPTAGHSANWLAAIIAILWVVHPLQTQSVTYVIQRCESLMGLFFLLTLYGFIRAVDAAAPVAGIDAGRSTIRPLTWYLTSIGCAVLGAGSKAVMIAAPLVVLLYDYCFVAASMRDLFTRRWAYYLALLASVIVVLQAVGVFASVFNPASGYPVTVGFGMTTVTWWQYLRTQPEIILHYLRLCLWPHPLCLDYEWPVAVSGYWLTGSMLLAMLVGTGLLLRRHPHAGFAAACFFLILAPSSSFIPVKDLAMEHRMYLPLAAVISLAMLAARKLLSECQDRWPHGASGLRRGALGAVCVIACAAMLGTILRNRDYASPVELWRKAVAVRPQSVRALYGLGSALIQEGRFAEATPPLTEAVARDASNLPARHNLAQAISHTGSKADAIQRYEDILKEDPSYAEAHINLGSLLLEQGRLNDALTHFEDAARLQPGIFIAHYNLARARAGRGELDRAVGHFQDALRIDASSADAHFQLAGVLFNLNRPADAAKEYEEALRLAPKMATAHLFRGNCLSMLGREREALASYEAGLEIAPRDVELLNARGSSLAALGQLDLAIAQLFAVLEIDPRHVNALLNRGNAYRAKGQLQSAIADYRAAVAADPKNAIAHYLLGHALTAEDRPGPAILEFEEALRINPKMVDALYEIGMAFEIVDRRPEAIISYQEVLKIEPDHAEAARRLRNLEEAAATQPAAKS